MAIFNTCYETSVGKNFNIKKIEFSILENFIKTNNQVNNLGVDTSREIKPCFLTNSWTNESEIPFFTHPTIIKKDQDKYLISDLRLFLKNSDQEDGNQDVSKRIKNLNEFSFHKNRAILNLLWVNKEYENIFLPLHFASSVYCDWLSTSITRAYNLDFKDQTTLSVIISFFYQSLFENKKSFDDEDKVRFTIHTIKTLRLPENLITSIFNGINSINNLDELCEVIKITLDNPRLKNFNLPVLLTLLTNSWFAVNSKEILSCALEHPPTWVSIVFMCITERTYKTTTIYRFIEKLGKKGLAEEFSKNYLLLIKSNLNLSNEEITIDKLLEKDFGILNA